MTRRAGLIVAVLAAAALRAYRLAGQSLWSDEDITLDRAQLPFRALLEGLPVEHAPGYFVAIRGWSEFVGTSDFALRYPSALAGAAAVVLTAYLARRLFGPRAELPAALLAAGNPFLIWYGQEARMYAPLAAVGAATLAVALRARRAPGRLSLRWLAVGILAAVTAYLHYYGVLVLAPLLLWGAADSIMPVLRGRAPHPPTGVTPSASRGRALGWIAAGTVALALFLPWLPRALRVLDFPGWREPIPLSEVARANLEAWAGGPTASAPDAQLAATAYALACVAGLLVALGRRRLHALLAAAGVVAASAVLAFMQSSCAPATLLGPGTCAVDLHPRYFAGVLPLGLVFAAGGVGLIPRPSARLAATLALLMTAVGPLDNLYHDPTYWKQDYRGFVQAVEGAAGHEDTVLFLDGPAYGLSRRYEMADSPVKIVNFQSSGNAERSTSERESRVGELAAEYPHLWVATNGEAWGDVETWLRANAYPVARSGFQDITLTRFFAPPADPADELQGIGDDSAAVAAACPAEDAVCLVVGSTSALPGQPVAVAAAFRPAAPLPDNLKISVRLLSDEGEVLASADRTVLERPGPGRWALSRSGLMAPAAAGAPGAPGTGSDSGGVALEVVLYRGDDLRPLATRVIALDDA